MGLFHKMTFAEAYRILLADFPPKKDLKEAYKTVSRLKHPEYDFERYTVAKAVMDLRSEKNIDSVFDCFTRLERENPDSPVMKQVRQSYGVHAAFANAVFSCKSVTGRIWVAMGYENGWSVDQNHETAVIFAEKLKEVGEDSPYYALAMKTYELIVDQPKAEEPSLEKPAEEEPKPKKAKSEKKKEAPKKPEAEKKAPQKTEDGIERVEMENGDVYEGGMKLGKYHGKGKYTSHKGWVYEGDFSMGEMSGEGRIDFPKGWYKGGMLIGVRHGKGEELYKDGARYVGEHNNDKRHGQGTLYYADGDTYEGSWKGGIRHGMGIYTTSVSAVSDYFNRTEGWWEEGKRVGWHKSSLVSKITGKVHPRDDEYYQDGKRYRSEDNPYNSEETQIKIAEACGTIFRDFNGPMPQHFNRALAVDFHGSLLDPSTGLIYTEDELGKRYVKYDDNGEMTHTLLLFGRSVQQQYDYVDYLKRPERIIVKQRIYMCIDGTFYKKEMYLDGDNDPLTKFFIFTLKNPDGATLDNCIYATDPCWQYMGALPSKGGDNG